MLGRAVLLTCASSQVVLAMKKKAVTEDALWPAAEQVATLRP
jgi:hypothetical protein